MTSELGHKHLAKITYCQWRHQGGMGAFAPPPARGTAPLLAPPSQKEKNGQNQSFSTYFWIFAPSESHFPPSMPPLLFMCLHELILFLSTS